MIPYYPLGELKTPDEEDPVGRKLLVEEEE